MESYFFHQINVALFFHMKFVGDRWTVRPPGQKKSVGQFTQTGRPAGHLPGHPSGRPVLWWKILSVGTFDIRLSFYSNLMGKKRVKVGDALRYSFTPHNKLSLDNTYKERTWFQNLKNVWIPTLYVQNNRPVSFTSSPYLWLVWTWWKSQIAL